MIRVSIRIFSIICATAAGLVLAGTHEVPEPPVVWPLNTLQAQAWQLVLDSGALVEQARVQHFLANDDKTGTALRMMRGLHEAAAHFKDQVDRNAGDPKATTEFLNLREEYFQAQPYFATLEDNSAVRAALWRTRDLMLDMAHSYSDYRPAAPPDPVVVSPRILGPPAAPDWKLRQMSADILRLSSNLQERAHSRELRGSIKKGEWLPFQRLDQVASEFHKSVLLSDGHLDLVEAEYEQLVYAMQGVRDVIGNCGLDLQHDFGEIWGKVQRLSYIYPSIPLGVYRISELNRDEPDR